MESFLSPLFPYRLFFFFLRGVVKKRKWAKEASCVLSLSQWWLWVQHGLSG